MVTEEAAETRQHSSRIPVPSPRTAGTTPAPPQDEGVQPRREGDSLFVSFPTPNVFKCTEGSCSSAYTAAAWTAKRPSLQRHLEGDHDMRIRRMVNLCDVCGATLGAKPTLHPCLANGRAVAAPTQQRYQCSECPQSFPSKKGLNNHLQWHSKEEAKRLRAESSRPVTDQLPATPATAAEVDNVEGQQNEATPHRNSLQSSSTPNTTFRGETGESPQATVERTSNHKAHNRREPQMTETTPAALENSSLVLAEHTKRLRQLLKSPPDDCN
ncbi:uncharacterized protein LOC144148331 [Haemaphysalis longicornis]